MSAVGTTGNVTQLVQVPSVAEPIEISSIGRRPELLPDDGDRASRRPPVRGEPRRRRRHAHGAARRGGGPGAGGARHEHPDQRPRRDRARLPRAARGDRPAGARRAARRGLRAGAADHRRRGRGQPLPLGPRPDPGDHVPAEPRRARLADGPLFGRRRAARADGDRGDLEAARSRRAVRGADQRDDHRRSLRRGAGAGADLRRLRFARGADRLHGAVRPRRLHRRAPDAGDRHPQGVRREHAATSSSCSSGNSPSR